MLRQSVQGELLDAAQERVYRSWTPEKRLEVALREMRSARAFMTSAVASQFPALSTEEIRQEVSRRILGHHR